MITVEDVRLIASARTKAATGLRYSDLTQEELDAYARVDIGLGALGKKLVSELSSKGNVELHTTSGFSPKGGVRGHVPKDIWFAVYPVENTERLAANPQLFMIVSERGLEFGFGAAVHPSDFSNQKLKDKVRATAPLVFDRLPHPGSAEATSIGSSISNNGAWKFRQKHRLQPNQSEFSDLNEWLEFLQSPQGHKNAAGTISRFLVGDEIDNVDLEDAVVEMAHLFEPLLLRDWENAVSGELFDKTVDQEEVPQTFHFAERLTAFLKAFETERSEPFSVQGDLKAAMTSLQVWIKETPAVASRDTVKVKLSVGQGNWTKTPWIALMDKRVTTSTQRGVYAVFLVSEDLTSTFLTLNQGMTDLVNQQGQVGAIAEMINVAETARPKIQVLRNAGFTLDNSIDLNSETKAAESYQKGTIAWVELQSASLPDDETVRSYLENLLSAYDLLIEGALGDEEELAEAVSDEIPPVMPFTMDDALAELFLERSDLERYLDIWKSKKNLILQGAPGVGKSFLARRLAYLLIEERNDRKIQAVQFHQSYSYEDFVQGYRPNGAQGFERKNGAFFEFRERALADPTGTYVFIIDEINRGNLSKILGELMLLIEPDKRGPEWATKLSYANSDEPDFYVPPNLYILGMMNTADRSLSVVDYALRRRFAFVSMDPMFGSPKFRAHLLDHGVSDKIASKVVSGMGELNKVIEEDRLNLGPGFRIGHSFFTPSQRLDDPATWYARIVETEIHPLLEEYWFDAPEKADEWRDQLL